MVRMTEDNALWHCDECNRDFKNQSALLSHVKTHAKPFVAPLAGQPPQQISIPIEIVSAGTPSPFSISGAGAGSREQSFVSLTSTQSMIPTVNPMMGVATTAWPGNDLTVKVKKLPHYGALPNIARGTVGSAGIDLYAAIADVMTIRINAWQLIPTGLCIEIPPGWVGLVVPRSGLAAKSGITILNTPGIIDSDYRGELLINLVNNTTSKFMVQPGSRIAQILFTRMPTVDLQFVDELSETTRGEGGFGSTGV